MKNDLLTADELRALLGITGKSSIENWEADGMPYSSHRGRRGGRPAHLYDKRRVLEWLRDNASERMSQRAAHELRKMDGGARKRATDAETTGNAATDLSVGESGKPGLEGALDRTEAVELAWYDDFVRARAAGDTRKAALCEKYRLAAAKGMAELRERWVNQMKEEGKLVYADDVAGMYMKILTGIRNNIMAMPSSAIPHLMPFLRDTEEAHKVEKILHDLAGDALRSVNAEYIRAQEEAERKADADK